MEKVGRNDNNGTAGRELVFILQVISSFQIAVLKIGKVPLSRDNRRRAGRRAIQSGTFVISQGCRRKSSVRLIVSHFFAVHEGPFYCASVPDLKGQLKGELRGHLASLLAISKYVR